MKPSDLVVAGRPNEALELVKSKLEETPSLALWCSLRDVELTTKHYHKASDMRHQMYGRAARSFGRIHFEKGDVDGAIEWFGKALAIQPHQPSAQHAVRIWILSNATRQAQRGCHRFW